MGRFDTWTPNSIDEQAGQRQRLIAERLGIEPIAGSTSQKPIRRIDTECRRRGHTRTAIGLAHHQRLHQPPYVPALFAEIDGQPIEQLRMARWFALAAEVFARSDQATSKQLLPKPIDRDTGREWVLLGS